MLVGDDFAVAFRLIIPPGRIFFDGNVPAIGSFSSSSQPDSSIMFVTSINFVVSTGDVAFLQYVNLVFGPPAGLWPALIYPFQAPIIEVLLKPTRPKNR